MPAKRKRSDRQSADAGRPAPHRPTDGSFQYQRDDHSGRGRGRNRQPRRDSSQHHSRPPSERSESISRPAATSPPATAPEPAPAKPEPVAAPPAPVAMAPQTRPSAPVEPRNSNFPYESISDDRIGNWATSGKDELVQLAGQAAASGDMSELSNLFQEFFYAVVDSKVPPADAGLCIKEIFGSEEAPESESATPFQALFLDSLAIAMESDADMYRPTLREFLIATDLSPTLMRELLDPPTLQKLGLIRETFTRFGVRLATNLLYRQANYNLLREESEGYSKLITELFTTSNVPPPPPEMAEQTFERIKALIGTFDLDVGRVLDVTLDVAAAVLIKQFKFFVKFLRVSSWWPRSQKKLASGTYVGGLPIWASPTYTEWMTSDEDEESLLQQRQERDVAFWERAREVQLGAFFELGGRQVSDAAKQLALTNGHGESHTDMDKAWIQETNTLPPPGNRVAAQLLGFKLRFYNSEMRTEEDVLPANLLYLAALLIKIGFISLTDLYPHLSPADDGMEIVREQQEKKMEEEERSSRGGAMNALLKAGVLPQGEDENPAAANITRKEAPTKAEEEAKQAAAAEEAAKPKLPEPLEQKVSLLIQLLTIGAIPESLFILGRFPWIPEAFPEVLSRIHRILNVSVEKVYNDSKPKASMSLECPTKPVPELDQSGVPKGNVKLGELPAKKAWRWPFPDKADTNDNQNYRFYWDEWSDNIPVCQTVDDVFTLCNTLLNISGVNIGKDEALLSKLASIGAQSLAEDASAENSTRWLDLLRRLLLPALSHTQANASVVNAIWNLLKRYPTTTRYALYAEWFEGQISRLPAMRRAFDIAISQTRGTMKRVSLTNLSEMAKQLAKTSLSSPGIVFRVAFDQLESYSNLIPAFVECAKYFTDLSYDVLVWSLMNSLGKSRSRTQADHALTTSKWLQALAKFTGQVFRRYSLLDATPVLYYVNNQLLQGNATDLIILEKLIFTMGGIADSVDFTDYQVLSMAGGQCLRKHTLLRAGDERFSNVKSSKRLIHALTNSHLAVRLLINLAQYRQAAIFKLPEDEAHIKLLSSMVDDSHQTLIKFIDLLWTNLDQAAFEENVPSIPELMEKYGIEVPLAFLIGRPNLAYSLFSWSSDAKETVKEADTDGDVAMGDKTEGVDAADETPEVTMTDSAKQDDQSSVRASLQPVIDAVEGTVDTEVWGKITPELYVTFWTLQLGDIFCPEDIYKQEADRLKHEEMTLRKDRSDMSRRAQEERTEKRKDLMNTQVGLLEERKEHYLRTAKWKVYLTKQFQTSFPNPGLKADALSDCLLEQCILPRIMLSPTDVEFTFRFIKALHEWNAPGFKLMSLYTRLFNANRLRSLIFTSTVREAEYLGRFLKLILEDLSKWHRNAPVTAAKGQPRVNVYEKEAIGGRETPRLGFALTVDENGKPATFVEHDQFRDLLWGWHKNLNMALKACLGGAEWMHIRNAITVLKTIVDCYPAVDFMGRQFMDQLQKITTQESVEKATPEAEIGGRVDLSVAAQGAMSELQRRKAKWVMVQAFRENTIGGKTEADSANSKLRPTAPDFNPQRNAGKKGGAAEEEDGEVKDGKDAAPTPAKDNLPPRPTRRDGPRGETPNSGHSRSSTPKPGAAGSRNDTPGGKLPDRPSHGLPTRPDVKIPPNYTPDRHPNNPRGHDKREGRDSREPRGGRDGQGAREPRDQSRHQGDGDRRGDYSSGDLPPRPRGGDQDRHGRGKGGRGGDRANDAAPAAASSTPAAADGGAEPKMNPDRAALFADDDRPARPPRRSDADAMQNVNPERAARLERDEKGPRSGRGSRTQSPRRGGPLPPSGPNEERHGRDHRMPGRNGRERDDGSFYSGRDSDPRGGYQDPNYGRLNPVQPGPETPSGPRPRGRGARSTQNTPTGPAGNRPGTAEGGRPASPDRQPPTGPSGGRGGRRNGYDGPTNSGSLAPGRGPADMPPPPSGPAMHQDRAAQFEHSTPTGPSGPRRHSGESNVPTGPAGSNDRHRGGKRQLDGINNTLQKQGPGSAPPTPSGGERDKWPDAPRGPAGGDDGRRDGRQGGRQSHGPGEYRDRRSLGADGGRGGPPGGNPPTGPSGGRDPRGPRGGDEWHGGGGNQRGRGGHHRSDDRREDRGRKRRSEEGTGHLSSDREKRPRR